MPNPKKKNGTDAAENTAVTKPTPREIIHPRDIPGLENIDREMLIIPRIKLVQALSTEVSEYEIPAGSLINSLTKDVYAKKEQELLIVPLMVNRSRILFPPIGEATGFLCRSFDGFIGQGEPGGECISCPKNKWSTKGEPPDCTEYLNVAVMPIVNDEVEPMPLILSFGRTSFGTGRQFINLMYNRRESPWNFSYALWTKFEKNDKGNFFVLKVKPSGKAPENLVSMMEASYNMLKTTAYEVHMDEEELAKEQQRMAGEQDQEEDEIPF